MYIVIWLPNSGLNMHLR